MKGDQKEDLRQAFKSSIRASYFNHLNVNQFTQKSKIQIQKISQDQDVDEDTFKINRKYKVIDNSITLIKQQGKLSPQSGGGFFSCFGRKQFHADLTNSVLKIGRDDNLKYYFDFNIINVDFKAQKKYFSIKVQKSEKSLEFYPVDQSVSGWQKNILKSIQNSQGKSTPSSHLLTMAQFYRTKYVSNTQFQLQCNTGDIILFRSQHGAARVQQLFLNSQYDHVAVVLRNKKNQIFLYQSSSSQGVGLTPWKYMIKYQWYASTEKVCWKKLNAKLQDIHFDTIQRFIAKTLGKGFDITFSKIFAFKSTIARQKDYEQNKTYFCSQLVARMYKQLGLIDQQVASTQYYPVTFSDAGNLKFLDPKVSLAKQCIIAFP